MFKVALVAAAIAGSLLTAAVLPHLTDVGVLMLFVALMAFAVILGMAIIRRSGR